MFGSEEIGDVDITTNGGAMWINLARYEEDHRTEHVVLDLGAYAGETAQVRFHYYNSLWEYWWMVDNVVVDGCYVLPGDMNCDGAVGTGDIAPFVLALIDPDAYIAAYPDCDIAQADMNGDGLANGLDVQLFVDVLLD